MVNASEYVSSIKKYQNPKIAEIERHLTSTLREHTTFMDENKKNITLLKGFESFILVCTIAFEKYEKKMKAFVL